MTRRLSDEAIEGLGRIHEAQLVNAHDKRTRVVTHASRIIDVLRGVESSMGVGPVEEERPEVVAELDTTPAEMPNMGWTGAIGAEGAMRGGLGEFYVSRFNNQPGSETFNAAFYAGVLAAKEGLIDPDQFEHDEVMHANFDPSTVFVED